ncbi:MAG TPA: hypothetical protein VJ397_03945 [Thermoplasmata archaeon]|nr:hypothetical protein [Thermoplasmata archaeon]
MRCSICGGPQDTPLCRWCGSEVLGDEEIALTLPPGETPVSVDREAVAGLLLLPAMEEHTAVRLAAKGDTLDTFLAAALPRRAVLHGVHHGMALALSLDTLDEKVATFSTLAECSVCGSAVREEDLACATCGTGVYLGESLTEIREMLSAAEAGPSDGRGLEELPAGFRRELEAILGIPLDLPVATVARADEVDAVAEFVASLEDLLLDFPEDPRPVPVPREPGHPPLPRPR